MLTRVLVGLQTMPRGVAFDDPRLPGLALRPTPLRLNTAPVPAAVLAAAGLQHADRVAAMVAWLQSQCGDYAVPRRRFVADYVVAIARRIEADRAGLTALLAPYDGLYRAEDWLWSALRPLPRAWVETPAGPAKTEMAFWDGTRLVAVDVEAALPADFELLPPGDRLPRSPFRRSALPLAA